MKDQVKGLGHFRCSGCGKACKVAPRKSEPVGNMAKLSCPDMVYPAKLQTPVLVEARLATPEEAVLIAANGGLPTNMTTGVLVSKEAEVTNVEPKA